MKLRHLETIVDDVAEIVITAEVDDRLVGITGLQINPGRAACLRRLYVDEAFRRRGVGSVLVENACSMATKAGCKSMGLHLAADNTAALAFYESQGFFVAYTYDDGSSAVCRLMGT